MFALQTVYYGVYMVKQTTISVRLTDDLLEKFDTVTTILRLGKADFVRGCIQKLCDDNAVLIDHHTNINEYVDFIKKELAMLSQDLLKVENGSWKDVKDSTIFLLCSEFWRTSKTVFSSWKKLIEEYNVLVRAFKEFSKDLEEWWVHTSFTFEGAQIENVVDLIDDPEEHAWLDYSAILNTTYSYATKKAIEETSAEKIVRDLLETEEKRENKRPLRLVLNARGEPRLRAHVEGKHYLSQVYTEKVES